MYRKQIKFLKIVLIFIFVVVISSSVKATYLGDVNEDGNVTSEDARLILRYSVGLDKPTNIQKELADLDGDKKITSEDSRLALRTATGLEKLKLLKEIYTNSLKIGDYLQFNGYAWAVYNSKENADKRNSTEVRYVQKGDIILIKEIDNNILKIGNSEYIYYGQTANQYFTKLVTAIKLELNVKSTQINTGDTITLTPKFTPSNAGKKLKWTSSNSSIVKVDTNGKIIGVKAGTATITATSFNGIKATCSVTVKNSRNNKKS